MPITFTEVRAAQHCLLRAWRVAHEAPDRDAPAPGTDAVLAHVRALAAPLLADAVDASVPEGGTIDAAARTRALIAQGHRRIRNARVETSGLRVDVDVLERTASGGWIAILVRSGSRVSWSLADRAAYTLLVLRAAGLHVAALHGLLLNAEYVRPAGHVVPADLFVRRSLSFPARRRLVRVQSVVGSLRGALAQPAAPVVEPGAHCRDDRDGCPYLGDCTAALPADWTGWFPRKDKPPIALWLAQGHVRMRDVADTGLLPRAAEHARRASRAGGLYVSPVLTRALLAAEPPSFYLDFECVAPAVPVYPGTRPYETVPFLWSVRLEAGAEARRVDGNVTEPGMQVWDDIAPPGPDPRRRIAEGLVRVLGASALPILVYSSYEHDRLRELEAALPDLAEPLAAIRARLVDLLDVVRDHVYDVRFRGSFSLKQVGPALAPDLSYADVPIRDGLAAATAYERLLAAPHDERDTAVTLAALRAYCARDTLALVRVHRALRRLAGGAA